MRLAVLKVAVYLWSFSTTESSAWRSRMFRYCLKLLSFILERHQLKPVFLEETHRPASLPPGTSQSPALPPNELGGGAAFADALRW